MSQRTCAPVHASYAEGVAFEFGSHSNDFLLRREQTLATETFTVRVPAGGAVPEHVHTDMEQTFIFVSGIGEATLQRGDDTRYHTCRPGDMLFVPTGWQHTVAASGIYGCVYVTVNAFVAEAGRIGDSALEHAEIAAKGFGPRTASRRQEPLPTAVARCAEAAFRPDASGALLWAQDFTAFDATLTGDPSTYRVRRLGPFEYVTAVTPTERVLNTDLADRLHAAVDGMLPVYVEGSQSPLSCKLPCASSDVDVLLAVSSADDIPLVRSAVEALHGVQEQVPVLISPGVVHAAWLGLPTFYSAVSLDPASPDRAWWQASDEQRMCEAVRRQREGLRLLEDPNYVREVLDRSLAVAGQHRPQIIEWRITPRWRGYL